MKNIFTSSINDSLMRKLKEYSEKYKMPKNKIIENALNNYFDAIKKAEYEKSFRKEKDIPENLEIAEAGLDDFLKMIAEQS